MCEVVGAMNLSSWDSYSGDQQQMYAAKIVEKTKAHEMPLLQYRMIHWDARVTDADEQVLTQWAHEMSLPAAGGVLQMAGDGDARLAAKKSSRSDALDATR